METLGKKLNLTRNNIMTEHTEDKYQADHQEFINQGVRNFLKDRLNKVNPKYREGFDGFKTDLHPSLAGIKKTIMDYADSFSLSTTKGFYIASKHSGSGKTFLASCLARRLIEKNYTDMMFRNTQLFFDSLWSSYGKDSFVDPEDIMNEVCNCSLLIFDDFGAERVTEKTCQRIYRIVNHRYEMRKPIVITTNLFGSDLVEKFMDGCDDIMASRIVSRLQEMCELIQMPEKDFRNV